MTKLFVMPSFQALFKVQALSAANDSLLRNAVIILFAYQNIYFFGLPKTYLINLCVLLFVLPFLLFSSYGGKLADFGNKVKIVRFIKLCEILIVITAALVFYFHQYAWFLVVIFALGAHSAFFGPIKYSILPQYFTRRDVVLANGYIEMSTFMAIIIGQTVGSWLIASKFIIALVLISGAFSLFGYFYSFKLIYVPPTSSYLGISKNLFKDSWHMYRKVTENALVNINIHAISWFWAIGVIYTIQLPLFTLKYLGTDPHVLALLLTLFSLGIGLGSLVCAKISRGVIVRKYVVVGAFLVSVFMLILLVYNYYPLVGVLSFKQSLAQHYSAFVLIFCFGFFAGFYSVTCYTDLQLSAADATRSQAISANNILNALYMVIASLLSGILSSFISEWWIMFIAAILNLLFCLLYSRSILSIRYLV